MPALRPAAPHWRRPVLLALALAALAATAGCSAWKLADARELARASQPYQQSPANPVGSLLVVGDSTGVGTGASHAAQSVAGLIGRAHPRLRIVNRAADGARYGDFVEQLRAADGAHDIVLVLGGGNDVIRNTGQDELQAHIRQVLELAQRKGERVLLMPPGNVGNAPFFWPPLTWWMTQRSQRLHTEVRRAALASGATYVNLYKPKEQDPFAQRPKELHARDGLHPSDAGYRLWFQELEDQSSLAQWLAGLGRT